jgi:biuret amidohydrolase
VTASRRLDGSIPYAWPYDGRLVGSSLALVICGAQRELVAASTGAGAVTERLRDAAGAVRRIGGRVVWVRHGGRDAPSRPTGSLPVRLTPGWELVGGSPATDSVVDASGWDGCFGSDLDHALRSRAAATGGWSRVVLGGYASEITVDSTVRTLNDRGHECLVLTDGCAPLDTALGGRAHASVTMSGGIFGALDTCTSLVGLLTTISSLPTPQEVPA